MGGLDYYRKILNRKKGELSKIESQIDELRDRESDMESSITKTEKARVILQTVAKETQEEIQIHISDLVSMALSSVFPDPYQFNLDFELKRGKTECNLYFTKDNKKFNPLQSSGYGVIDIASFSLRVALWSLSNPVSRNTLILDEPFKFVSKDYLSKVAEMIKEISNKMGLQIIMVTHLNELMDSADKTFKVDMERGISRVKEV